MRSLRSRLFVLVLASAGLCACAADDLDCSLGAMKSTCPPGTVGFDRLQARLRDAQRLCLKRGLETGSDAYAACLAAEGPSRARPRVGRFDHLGSAVGPATP